MREMKATLLRQVESLLLKISLVRLRDQIKSNGLDARIVASILDSIWMETPLAREHVVSQIMNDVMTTATRLDVRLEVDFM